MVARPSRAFEKGQPFSAWEIFAACRQLSTIGVSRVGLRFRAFLLETAANASGGYLGALKPNIRRARILPGVQTPASWVRS